VGKRNYKYFIYFLISTTVLMVLMFWLCGKAIVEKMPHNGSDVPAEDAIKALVSLPLVCIVLALLLFEVCSIGPLLVYHMYLITIGQTTNENVRDVYLKEENVFNRGWFQNFKRVLLADRPPSALGDLTEVVSASDYMNTIREERAAAEV
jgi:hypothetical protein